MLLAQSVSLGGSSPNGKQRRFLAKSALAAIAILALVQAGCQSGGCSSCGLRGRLFNRRATVAEPVLTDPATLGGAPTIVEPSTQAPATTSDEPGYLKPTAPEGGGTDSTKGASGATGTGAKKTTSVGGAGTRGQYETSRAPRAGLGQPRDQFARLTPRAPTNRISAKPGPVTSGKPAPAADDPLDHLTPPATLPEEAEPAALPDDPPAPVAKADAAAAGAKSDTQSAAAPATPAAANEQPKSNLTDKPSSETPTIKSEPAENRENLASKISLLPPPASAAAPAEHYSTLAPTIAGGALPTAEGLDWLVDKGYKTLLDLREPGEVQPEFIGQVSQRGLRYLALPVKLEKLTLEKIERFQRELDQETARPIYFFDGDGSRAGAMWFVASLARHKERLDLTNARREAKELGLIDAKAWGLAESQAKSLLDPKRDSTAPADHAAATAPPQTGAFPEADAETAAPAVVDVVGSKFATPINWQPYAAMLITILGVPLAFWSRSGFPLRGFLKHARNEAAQRPRSLPAV